MVHIMRRRVKWLLDTRRLKRHDRNRFYETGCEEDGMAELRIGVVGLHNHYHAFPFADEIRKGIPGVRLVAVADERAELARGFAADYCDGDWTDDYDALIARDDVDALIVTSDTAAHAEHVEAAAAAGKHVLLDKPIATTLEDADRIVAAADRVKIMLAYLLRYVPANLRAYEALQAGAVGRLVSGTYSIRVPASFIKDSPSAGTQGWYADPARSGGGGFLDHAVHFTDFFRWFFASEAVSVVARIDTLVNHELGVDDYGIAIYTLESGAIVTVEASWHAPGWYAPLTSPDRCSLTGTDGEIELHYQKSPQLEIQGNTPPYDERRYLDFAGDARYERCYRDMLIEFASAIAEDRPMRPDAEDGRRALEMVLAAYESQRRGGAVALPLVGTRA
jgi:predicted dehydrogenase